MRRYVIINLWSNEGGPLYCRYSGFNWMPGSQNLSERSAEEYPGSNRALARFTAKHFGAPIPAPIPEAFNG